MGAAVITFTRYDAGTLEIVIAAALRHRELEIDWEAAARVCVALSAWRGRGFSVVPVQLTAGERDAGRLCWEALALSYAQISERQYNHVLRVLLVG